MAPESGERLAGKQLPLKPLKPLKLLQLLTGERVCCCLLLLLPLVTPAAAE